MDLHYKREAMVGAIVLAGAAVFVVGTMWLGGKSFGRDNLVPVQFSDIGNLKSSSPVKVSGVQVGKVDKIIFDSVGSVRVNLALTQNVPLRADAGFHSNVMAKTRDNRNCLMPYAVSALTASLAIPRPQNSSPSQ